jgi:hypothetical protein
MTAAKPAENLRLVKVLDRMTWQPELGAICVQLAGKALF